MDTQSPRERDIIEQAGAINILALKLVNDDRQGERIWWGDVDKIAKMAEQIVLMHGDYTPLTVDTRIDDSMGIFMESYNGKVGATRLCDLWEAECTRVSTAWPRLAAQIDAEPTVRGMSGELEEGVKVRTYVMAGRVMMTIATDDADVTWIGEDDHPEKGLGLQSVHATTSEMQRFVDLFLLWRGDLVADRDVSII